MPQLVRSFVCLLALLASAAAAMAEDWTVKAAYGRAWISTPGAAPVRARAGSLALLGSTIETGVDGRVRLVGGGDVVDIAPRSIVILSSPSAAGLETILERRGRIELDIEHRPQPHFTVETPWLASVVKGTHFVVRTGRGWSSVRVTRGIVNALALATGENADIVRGQTARASRRGLSLSGAGVLPQILRQAPREPLVEGQADGAAPANVDTASPPSGRAGAGAQSSGEAGAASDGSAQAATSGGAAASGSPAAAGLAGGLAGAANAASGALSGAGNAATTTLGATSGAAGGAVANVGGAVKQTASGALGLAGWAAGGPLGR